MAKGRKPRPLSVGKALGDGFGLLTARPLSAAVWGVTMVALTYGPMLLFARDFYGNYVTLLGSMTAQQSPEATRAAMARFQSGMAIANLASYGGVLLAMAIVPTAIFRTVLRPGERSAFGLRLGKAEALQALVWLVYFVTTMLVYIAIALVAVLIGVVAWLSASAAGASFETSPWPHFGLIALVIAAVTALVWIMLRLSMGRLLSFDSGSFRLFDSFAFTRGRVWRLFGLGALICLIVLVVELIAVIVLLVALAASGVALDGGGLLKALQSPAAPWIGLGAGVVLSAVIVGPIYAVATGAWTSAYRQLRGADEAPAPQES